MISPTELAAMRATAEAALIATCTIKRITRSSDNMGGHTELSAVIGTEPCRVDLLSSYSAAAKDLELVGDQIQDQAMRIINLPWDADVELQDRLEIGGEAYSALRILEEGWTVVKQVIGMRL